MTDDPAPPALNLTIDERCAPSPENIGGFVALVQELVPLAQIPNLADLGEIKVIPDGETRGGGPAAKAGIRPGELIVSLAGHPVSSPADVTDILATLKPGRTVSVGLVRPDGSKSTLKVQLGQYPGSLG